MKVSDYIAGVIGGYCPFVVQGGAAVHLIDSLSAYTYMCMGHEQGAGFAADGYAKVKGLGVVVSTCGPGATNLVTAAASAYFESVPVLYMVGQQHEFQEIDVVGMFQGVTRYAKQVTNARTLAYDLEEALQVCVGTPGPVLLNVFDEVYRAEIDSKPEPFLFEVEKVVEHHNCRSYTTEIYSKDRNPAPTVYRQGIDPYRLIASIPEDLTVVTDIGNHGVWVKQVREAISDNQFGAMGYALPASIGVAKAGKRVVSINGDGGIQMNIQELATVAKHELDIKIFVLNNRGYGMIRATQDVWLEGRHAGCDLKDLPLVDFERVATAYGIPSRRWDHAEDLEDMERVLSLPGPVLVNVMIDPDFPVA